MIGSKHQGDGLPADSGSRADIDSLLPPAAKTSIAADVGLVTLLTVPSLFLFDKFGGHLGSVVAFVYVAALIRLSNHPALIGRLDGMSERQARILAGATTLAVIVIFAVLYPLSNSGRFGQGSDNDEALNLATTSLLNGQFPYRQVTYLGNQLSPLPGSLVFASPFVLLGNAAYQMFFWLPLAAFLVWRSWGRHTGRSLAFFWLVALGCPAVLYQVAVGNDYAVNALVVTIFSLMLATAGERNTSTAGTYALAVGLGVALSSRPNFLLILPLLFSRLWQEQPPRRALGLTALVVGVAVAVTLPFFLYDPEHFSPTHALSKLSLNRGSSTHMGLIVPILGFVVACALARPAWNKSAGAFLRNAALVQASMVLGVAVVTGMSQHRWVDLYPTIYGQFFLYFGLGAFVASKASARTQMDLRGLNECPRNTASLQGLISQPQ
jgi:hypothetical protein